MGEGCVAAFLPAMYVPTCVGGPCFEVVPHGSVLGVWEALGLPVLPASNARRGVGWVTWGVILLFYSLLIYPAVLVSLSSPGPTCKCNGWLISDEGGVSFPRKMVLLSPRSLYLGGWVHVPHFPPLPTLRFPIRHRLLSCSPPPPLSPHRRPPLRLFLSLSDDA